MKSKVQWISIALLSLVWVLVAACGGGGSSGSASVTVLSVSVNPSEASLYFGDELLLTATGGTPPYAWSSGNLTVGTIDPTRTAFDGSTTFFVANTKRPESGTDNMSATVTAMDSTGRTAQATVTMVDFLLQVTPSEATIALDTLSTPTMRFFASGGDPPFFWSADKPYLADLYLNSDGSVATLIPKSAGTLTLTVHDSRNVQNTTVITILEQNPNITPAVVTVSHESTVSFRLSDGTPPYTLYVSDPNIILVGDFDGASTTVEVTTVNVGLSDLVLEDSAGLKAVASVTVTDLQGEITISPSAMVLGRSDFVSLAVLHGLSPYFWTNENPELGDLISVGEGNTSAIFQTGNDSGVATVVVEDARQLTAVARITIADALRILPGSVTAVQGSTGLTFLVQGGIPPYSALLKDYRFGTVTQPALSQTSSQYEFTASVDAAAEVKTWTDVIEIYDVGGLKATVDVVVAN